MKRRWVRVCSAPRGVTEASSDVADKRTESALSIAQETKKARLEQLEAAKEAAARLAAGHEDEPADSFASRLVTKIVDNIQVRINKIHIRLEDDVSCPGHPFACGLTLHVSI